MYSIEGYKKNSPDRNNPFNIINSKFITMRDVEFPVMGVSNTGHKILMQPGQDYVFDGDYVIEFPVMQQGGRTFSAYKDIKKDAKKQTDAKKQIESNTSYYKFLDKKLPNVLFENEIIKREKIIEEGDKNYENLYQQGKITEQEKNAYHHVATGLIRPRVFNDGTEGYVYNRSFQYPTMVQSPNTNDYEKEKDFFIDWYNSPITREKYDKLNIDKSNQPNYNQIIDNIETLNIKPYPNVKNLIIDPGGKGEIPIIGSIDGIYDPTIHTIYGEPSIVPHEISHGSKIAETAPISSTIINNIYNDEGYTDAELDYMKPKDKAYFKQPTEVYARVNAVRYAAGLKPGEKITMDKLYEFFNTPGEIQKAVNDLGNVFKPKGILRLFNELAQNNNKTFSNLQYAQQGGTTGMDGMMKARLAIDSHFGNPTARRMTNYDTRSYEFPDGGKGNVYVSSYDNLVTPQIQDINGKLMFIDNPWSKENTDRSYNQSMKFERDEDAQYFGENYKKYAPMMGLYKKQEGGTMNEEIIMKIQEALQQGATPEQLIQELQKQGISQEEATQMVSAAMPQEEMQQYQYGSTVRHNYVDNINFNSNFKKAGEDWGKVGQSFKNWNNSEWGDASNKFDWKTVGNALGSTFTKGNINSTALGLNAVSDPRNMTWALPDTGFGSGFKAISGLASGLAGSYLGYAKLFAPDNRHVQDPTEKPIVSSPYIPEGKDVTKIVKSSSDVPTWDWQTQHPDLTAANTTGKASYSVPNKDNTVMDWYTAPGQNTIGPVEFAKGGMKKYQRGDQVDSSGGAYDFNIGSLTPNAVEYYPNQTFQQITNIQNPWLQQYGDQSNPHPPRVYTKDAVPNRMSRQSYQNYYPDATIDEGSIATDSYQNKNINPNSVNTVQNNNLASNKTKSDTDIVSMNDDALGFMIANNALIGFQNFNDVVSAKDYEKEYNQMLMRTGNTDKRYNPLNPTNPYGMYTPNAGIGSNYGLVANSYPQDFGTSMASAKCGGMKKYQEGGEYNLTQEEIDYILKNGGEIEIID